MLTTLLDARILGVSVRVDAYPALLYGGAVLGIALALWLARARGLPFARVAAVLAAAALAVPVGSRALHVLTDPSLFAENPSAAFEFALTGFSLYGGLTAAVLVAVAGARIARVDLWRLADATAPGIALGIALAKLGCFCEGCCHGVVSAGPLAVRFPAGSPSHAAQMLDGTIGFFGAPQPVLPTQLFESAGALAFGVAALLLARRLPDGVAFLLFAAGFSAVRLVAAPLRWIEPSFSAPSWFYPATYLAVIVVCGGLAWWRFCVSARNAPTTDEEPPTHKAESC